MTDTKTLLLIDGSSFLFRAFHALPNLTAPDGTPTGATYGIINMIKQLNKKYSDSLMLCVFDTTGETFRDVLHDQYKAHRSATPEELIVQLQDIFAIIKAQGIPVIMQNGIEADDIIGSIAYKASLEDFKVVIATGDKDFIQLLTPENSITLINTMNNEFIDYDRAISKYEIKPEQFIDYLTLIGDKSDNIPGVDKCGPKTAVKWLTKYNTLENIILCANELEGKVGENLRQSISWLETAKKLVTIKIDFELTNFLSVSNLNELKPYPIDTQLLEQYYTRLGFKSWLQQLKNNGITSEISLKDTTQIVTNKSNTTLPLALDNKPTCLITDVNNLQQTINKIISENSPIAILIIPNDFLHIESIKYLYVSDDKNNYIIEIQNSNALYSGELELFDNDSKTLLYLDEIKKLLLGNNPKILANYKDTLTILSTLNLELNNVKGDLTLAHYLKNSRLSHKLSFIFNEYFQEEIIDYPLPFSAPSKSSLWVSQDSSSIHNNCIKIIEKVVALEQNITSNFNHEELKLYQEVELPLAHLLVLIEKAGIKIDVDKLYELDKILTTLLNDLEQEVYKLADIVFNINSAKQLSDVLFNKLHLPTEDIKKNSNGYSTDEDSLKKLASQNIPLADILLQYRSYSKLLNTYISKLPKLIDQDSRLHTTFEQALVTSGRLSSRDPNLQNIPIKNEYGQKIRACFIAKPGSQLVCADYSQIELRVLAHLSKDSELIKAFNDKLDIHSITASEIFNKPIDLITREERRHAKIVNFSLLYGKTAFGLSQELNIDRVTAKRYIEAYFAKYPKVKEYLDSIIREAQNYGYTQTIFGRKVYLPNINHNNKILREAEERLALNSPMQGSSADIIKIAMLKIDKWLRANNLTSKIVLQIHDELILECGEAEIELILKNLPSLMTDGYNLLVNLEVNCKVASNWEEAH